MCHHNCMRSEMCDHNCLLSMFQCQADSDDDDHGDAWTTIKGELDKVWKDLAEACKKADKTSKRFDKLNKPQITHLLESYASNLNKNLELCEKDKYEVEYAVKWKKTRRGDDVTLSVGQELQVSACGHLEDLLATLRNMKANFPKEDAENEAALRLGMIRTQTRVCFICLFSFCFI